jgi:uncharacterized protein (DUF305 family)
VRTDRPARARRLAESLRLAALLVAGVAATAASAQPPAPPAAPRPARPARHRPADAAFMRGMIGHHAQALAMTALVPARARRPEVRLIAERIEVSQHDEIALMRRWLADRGEPAPDSAGAPGGHGAHDAHGTHAGAHAGHGAAPAMPGMLTADELARLAAARGDAFDRLFLTYMIRHHEGALTMVARLLATPGAAQESETFGFASDVDADQRAEIARMRALLGAPSPTPRHHR